MVKQNIMPSPTIESEDEDVEEDEEEDKGDRVDKQPLPLSKGKG